MHLRIGGVHIDASPFPVVQVEFVVEIVHFGLAAFAQRPRKVVSSATRPTPVVRRGLLDQTVVQRKAFERVGIVVDDAVFLSTVPKHGLQGSVDAVIEGVTVEHDLLAEGGLRLPFLVMRRPVVNGRHDLSIGHVHRDLHHEATKFIFTLGWNVTHGERTAQ